MNTVGIIVLGLAGMLSVCFIVLCYAVNEARKSDKYNRELVTEYPDGRRTIERWQEDKS